MGKKKRRRFYGNQWSSPEAAAQVEPKVEIVEQSSSGGNQGQPHVVSAITSAVHKTYGKEAPRPLAPSKKEKMPAVKPEVIDITADSSQATSSQGSDGVRSRPGRRAARLAAEKIQKTVRKYGLFNDDEDDFDKTDDFDAGGEDDDDDEDYDEQSREIEKKKLPTKPSPQKKDYSHISLKRPQPPPPLTSAVKRPTLTTRTLVQRPTSNRPTFMPVTPKTPVVKASSGAVLDMDLHMECTEEVLSQAQIAALKKSGEAYDTAMRLLREYRAAGARIIYSHDTVHASTIVTLDSTDITEEGTTVVVHTTPPVTPTTTTITISTTRTNMSVPSTPLVTLPKPSPTVKSAISSTPITIAPSTPVVQQPLVVTAPQSVQLMRTVGGNQQAFLVAATPVPGVPASTSPVTTGTSPLAYKVLIDSRTGVVVGTLPPDANIVNSPTTGTAIRPSVGSAISTQKAIRTPEPVKTNLPATRPPPLHPAMQKPVDDTMKNLQQFNRNKSVPLISGGSKIVTAHSLLAVKLQCWKEPADICARKIDRLKKWLDGSKFTEEPIQWMIEHRLLPEAPTCSFCNRVKMDLVEDTTCFDGVKWHCPHPKCGKYHVVSRMSFFARFGVSMAKLLSLVYHWAIQSDIETVMKEINVDIYMIRSVWRAIQEVCARAVSLRSSKLGGRGVKVEVSRAQIGRFLVLAAYDRTSRDTRLKVVSVTLGWNSVISQKCLESWLLPKTTVLSCDKRLTDLQKSGINHVMIDPGNMFAIETHVGNVRRYLETKLNALFGDLVVHQLKLETIQGFLDELQWRERYSKNPSEAFWNILRDIAEQCGRRVLFGGAFDPPEGSDGPKSSVPRSSGDKSHEVVTIPNSDDEEPMEVDRELSLTSTCKPEKMKKPSAQAALSAGRAQKITSRSQSRGSSSDEGEADVLVVLDEYYYATKDPNPEMLSKLAKGNFLFRCHICKKVLDNNIKAMKHISGHIENNRHKNLDLSDLTQCKYCYRDFETPYSMQCHVEQVHLMNNALACRICNQAFSQTSLLTKHMKVHHKQSEMPYSCQACEFRSSFQREILEHFQQEHAGTDKLLCHYCLKVYNVTFSKSMNIGLTQMFYYHLYKHQCKSISRKCPQCCLVFLNLHDLRMHRVTDHESRKDLPGVHPMKATDPNPILVRDPHKVRGKKTGRPSLYLGTPPRLKPRPKTMDITPLEEKYTGVMVEGDMVSSVCWECKAVMDPEHFSKYVSCGHCRYATNCSKAYVDHMICKHSALSKKRPSLANLKPVWMPSVGFCTCGYRTAMGNTMATHMANCDSATCYVTSQEMIPPDVESTDMPVLEPFEMDMPDPCALLQVEMEESEEGPLKVDKSEVNSADDDTQGTSEGNDEKASEDRPDMLNALGLIRRKSSSDPPSTPSSVDENSIAPQEVASSAATATSASSLPPPPLVTTSAKEPPPETATGAETHPTVETPPTAEMSPTVETAPLAEGSPTKEIPPTADMETAETPPMTETPPTAEIETAESPPTEEIDTAESPPTEEIDTVESPPTEEIDTAEIPPKEDIETAKISPTAERETAEILPAEGTETTETPPTAETPSTAEMSLRAEMPSASPELNSTPAAISQEEASMSNVDAVSN